MGLAKKAGIDLDFDLADGYYATGFAKGLSEGFSSKYYLTSVVEYAFAMMGSDFKAQMAAVAQTKPWAFQHVYEPGHVGEPGFELWTNKLYGRGEKRQASFQWEISKLPILKPEERLHNPDNPNDPINKAYEEMSDEAWDKLNDEDYVFRMRAPIMEYGLMTVITPRPGTKALFIPTDRPTYHWSGSKKKGTQTATAKHFRFDKANVPDWDYKNPQDPSGAGTTVGQFTKQWVAYWAGGGSDATFQNHVRRGIEGGLDDWGREFGKKVKGNRTRRQTAKMHTFKSAKAAEESGRNLAAGYIRGKARTFAQASKYIDKYGVYGGQRI